MSGAAIVMMVVSMAIIWGGLAAAIINLRRGGEGDPSTHRDL